MDFPILYVIVLWHKCNCYIYIYKMQAAFENLRFFIFIDVDSELQIGIT